MPWSWSNIDWNGTGAMVQAVGSVAAILAAIRIDHGAARRLERQRRDAEQQAKRARVRAIDSAIEALRGVATTIEAAAVSDTKSLMLTPQHLRPMSVADAAIEYYLRQGGDPEPELVFALSRSAHCLKAGFRTIDRTGMIFARQRVSLANELRGLADEIELELSQKSGTR